MKIRNLLLSIIILLTFLPVVAHAQVDINRLQSGKRGFGFGYRSSPDYLFPHSILITGDHSLTESIKYSGQVVIHFDPDYFEEMMLEFKNQIMHIASLKSSSYDAGDSDYGYFLLGGIDINYLYLSEDVGELDSDFHSLVLFAGGGLYASFGPLKPFVHYTFNHLRIFEKFRLPWEEKTLNLHRFSVGTHINFSDNISLMGRVAVPRVGGEFGDPFFEIGINFGLGKRANQPPIEAPTRTTPTRTTPTRTTPTRTTPTRTTPTRTTPTRTTPTTPESYRYQQNDILLVRVKDYIYFAKVSEDTKTTAKDIPVQFFIEDVHVIAGRSVLLDAVHAKREKPKDGWGSQKVTIEYYDGTAWKKMSDVLVFEDFYLLPETAPGERRIGLDKIRIPNLNY